MSWRVELLNDAVGQEIMALPADIQGRFLRLGERITLIGLERMGEPHVKHIEGKLWEMRLMGKDWDSARVLRYRGRTPRRCRPGIHQKDAENSAQ